MASPVLVLASGSPRRASLLAQLGIRFRSEPADIDETIPEHALPAEAVVDLARQKVEAAPPGSAFVLGADTIVVIDGDIIGKPLDPVDAVGILSRLQGRTHEVYTGVAVRGPDGELRTAVETTRVEMAALDERQIEAYVTTGEPLDKAGAYAIQGAGAAFVERVEGDYSNVVGLPLRATLRLLTEAGFPLPPHLRHGGAP